MDTATREYAVLLIEDDLIDQEAIRRTLRETGQVSVTTAGYLHDGMQLIRQTPFDAVLFDLGLPDSFGIDTIKRMTEEFQSTPLIVLTGLSDIGTAQLAISHGVRDYLVKGEASEARILTSIFQAVRSESVEPESSLNK